MNEFRASSPWLTLKQAAEVMGVSPPVLYNALQYGRTSARARNVGAPPAYGNYRSSAIRYYRDSLSWSQVKAECEINDEMATEKLPQWVTIQQAADYWQLSTKTIRRHIAHRKLKAVKVGREFRIERESMLNLGRRYPY